ncbi:hypothetical protein L3X38_000315 [Prunus dulcis]|uniref:Uncharacterized protein n=1 Tax=Prunus dulcis TaxID=3755 RepID=A0AAD4YK09_PRUDU|nr:hypothetical protein L3X38_000315 [Prunus dulcis]
MGDHPGKLLCELPGTNPNKSVRGGVGPAQSGQYLARWSWASPLRHSDLEEASWELTGFGFVGTPKLSELEAGAIPGWVTTLGSCFVSSQKQNRAGCELPKGLTKVRVAQRTGPTPPSKILSSLGLATFSPARKDLFLGAHGATSQGVTHPEIALAPNSLNFGVPTTPKPVSSQEASSKSEWRSGLAQLHLARYCPLWAGPTPPLTDLFLGAHRAIPGGTPRILIARGLLGAHWLRSCKNSKVKRVGG